MSKNEKRIIMVLVLLLLYLVPILFLYTTYRRRPEVIMVSRQHDLTAVTQVHTRMTYPTDTLFEDQMRTEYTADSMRLVVPRMKLNTTIGDGIDDETLAASLGLYDCAQLPSLGNPNVSIAGHRDINEAPFYSIDKLQKGDNIYLVYDSSIYCYIWEQTLIIEPDDWSVIYCRPFSSVTLTSCEPIGTTDKRIVAVGRLDRIEAEATDFSFT